MKYYFKNRDSENCYTKDYFIEEMKERGVTEIEVYPAVIMIGEPFFWCSVISECFEKGENSCGKFNCNHYKPRNGKNGICRFYRNCYEVSEKSIILKL
jgi:hypothetical protein